MRFLTLVLALAWFVPPSFGQDILSPRLDRPLPVRATSIAFSDDGALVALGDDRGAIHVYETGRFVRQALIATVARNRIVDLAFSGTDLIYALNAKNEIFAASIKHGKSKRVYDTRGVDALQPVSIDASRDYLVIASDTNYGPRPLVNGVKLQGNYCYVSVYKPSDFHLIHQAVLTDGEGREIYWSPKHVVLKGNDFTLFSSSRQQEFIQGRIRPDHFEVEVDFVSLGFSAAEKMEAIWDGFVGHWMSLSAPDKQCVAGFTLGLHERRIIIGTIDDRASWKWYSAPKSIDIQSIARIPDSEVAVLGGRQEICVFRDGEIVERHARDSWRNMNVLQVSPDGNLLLASDGNSALVLVVDQAALASGQEKPSH